jgi:NhaA family Na+:H+ antiporter
VKEKAKQIVLKLRSARVLSLTRLFLEDESIGGKLILIAAVLSLVVVNSPLQEAYTGFWQQNLSFGIGSWSLSMDIRHWVNEGLMAIFFLVVGLEIKREIVEGKLRTFKTAILPIGAAIGGMVIPALIYVLFNIHTSTSAGWGIPIATDIAFAVAILVLLGKRVPFALKVFLLTLAIADDIGAIIVIALFYAEIIHYGYLALSLLIAVGIFVLRKWLSNKLLIVGLAGISLWITAHLSGIHASVVGAVMGLLAPVATTPNTIPLSEKVEKSLLPVSTFLVLPIFAFANAGFILSAASFTAAPSVFWGILLGLVAGKAFGITFASWFLLKLKIAELPAGVTLRHVLGVGFLAGIGFTVSIFITELAFSDNHQLIEAAKLAIFIASFISAIVGSVILLKIRRDS